MVDIIIMKQITFCNNLCIHKSVPYNATHFFCHLPSCNKKCFEQYFNSVECTANDDKKNPENTLFSERNQGHLG